MFEPKTTGEIIAEKERQIRKVKRQGERYAGQASKYNTRATNYRNNKGHGIAMLDEKPDAVESSYDRAADALAKQRDFVNEKIEQLAELRDMTRGQLLKAFPDGDVDAAHKKLLAALCAQEEEMEDAFRQAEEAHALAAHAQGYGQHAADTIQDIDAQIAEERSKLDVWIRKYNAHHSPVQFPELEQTFSSAMDWNALRREARDLTLQNMLAEARAEEARVALAAHQVNALSQGQDKEDRTTALNTEIARLESERERIQVQIAGCQARLDAHELGLQKLAAGENQHHNP